MKLATVRDRAGTRAVRVEGDTLVNLGAEDLAELFSWDEWREAAGTMRGDTFRASDMQFTKLVRRPSKIICVGLNYRAHIAELGARVPEEPTIFAKFDEALIGPTDRIVMPRETQMLDWEVELALVIGTKIRSADEEEAAGAIAGFTIMNDVTVRDWQYRTTQWLAGKAWEGTTPVGPVLVTPEELPGGVRPDLQLTCTVDGEMMQQARTSDLLFDPVALVRYISVILTLRPGDVISTGTPSGIGDTRSPKKFLKPGSTVTCEIEGIGSMTNVVVAA